jgi:hypothetical protein
MRQRFAGVIDRTSFAGAPTLADDVLIAMLKVLQD